MAERFLSVPTRIKGRFRKLQENSLQRLYVKSASEIRFRQAALAQAGQDATMRFLVEMDNKLEAILVLLQRERIEADFPHEGHILELGGSGLVLECGETLYPGQQLELLLTLGSYSHRLVSVAALVREKRDADASGAVPGGNVYAVEYSCMSEEDREMIIAFIFQEERKRIRRQKEE